MPRGSDRGGLKVGAGGRVVAPEPEAEHSLRDSLLPWLIRGVHVVHVDRRRRSGAPAGLRRLLADDAPAAMEEPWRDLASGLQRQAVSQGFHQLRPREKEVIRLAYLEGRTNQEIADRLGVSVSTVRRRIHVALRDMEAFLRRTGGALSVLVLVAAAQLATRSTRITRSISTSTRGMRSVAAVASAGAAIVSTVAIVALTPPAATTSSPGPGRTQSAPSPAIRQSAPPAAAVDAVDILSDSLGLPVPAEAAVKPAADQGGTPGASGAADAPAARIADPNPGCDGNPTSAAPAVPVGPRNNQASGAPVSHPTAGGCRR